LRERRQEVLGELKQLTGIDVGSELTIGGLAEFSGARGAILDYDSLIAMVKQQVFASPELTGLLIDVENAKMQVSAMLESMFQIKSATYLGSISTELAGNTDRFGDRHGV